MNRMLKTAAEEYKAAIANNKFVELIEYQDSRGFVLYAEDLYKNIADQMSQKRPEDHKVIAARLRTQESLACKPATPVKTPQFTGLLGD